MIRLAFASALVVVSVTASLRGGDAKEDLKAMEGEWTPATGEFGGKPFPEETLKTIKLVLKDDTYTVTVGDKVDRGTVKLDVSKSPKTLDITGTEGPNKGKTFTAIYELSGDTLKVCYNLTGTERPSEFKTKEGTQQFLVTYKKAKR